MKYSTGYYGGFKLYEDGFDELVSLIHLCGIQCQMDKQSIKSLYHKNEVYFLRMYQFNLLNGYIKLFLDDRKIQTESRVLEQYFWQEYYHQRTGFNVEIELFKLTSILFIEMELNNFYLDDLNYNMWAKDFNILPIFAQESISPTLKNLYFLLAPFFTNPDILQPNQKLLPQTFVDYVVTSKFFKSGDKINVLFYLTSLIQPDSDQILKTEPWMKYLYTTDALNNKMKYLYLDSVGEINQPDSEYFFNQSNEYFNKFYASRHNYDAYIYTYFLLAQKQNKLNQFYNAVMENGFFDPNDFTPENKFELIELMKNISSTSLLR